jgi:hypothetical protein
MESGGSGFDPPAPAVIFFLLRGFGKSHPKAGDPFLRFHFSANSAYKTHRVS